MAEPEAEVLEPPVIGDDEFEAGIEKPPVVPLKTKEKTFGPVEKAGPFDGMTYGQAALKLLGQPDLASDFDAKFKGHVEEVNTMERARLHGRYEWVTQTVWGSQHLKWLAGKVQEASTPEGKAALLTKVDQETINGWQEEYNGILADIATYKRMKPVGLNFQSIVNLAALVGNPAIGLQAALRDEGSAAVVGAVAGTMMSPESWAGWPIRGAAMVWRVLAGAAQGIAVNAGADPFIQLANIDAGIQEEYNWTQTLLKGGIGGAIGAGLGAIVPGGGIVRDGQVVSNAEVRAMINDLAKDDPMWGAAPTASATNEMDGALPPKTTKEAYKRAEEVTGEPDVTKRPVDEAMAGEIVERTPVIQRAEDVAEPVAVRTPIPKDQPPAVEGEPFFNDILSRYQGTPAYQRWAEKGKPGAQGFGPVVPIQELFDLKKLNAEELGRLFFEIDRNPTRTGPNGETIRFEMGAFSKDPKVRRVRHFERPEGEPGLSRGEHVYVAVRFIEPPESTTAGLVRRGITTRLAGERVRTPIAEGTVPSAVVKSEQRMVEEFSKDFDVDIRQGRVKSASALAEYNTLTGVARTQEISDFQAAAHEAAHKLDQELQLGGIRLGRRAVPRDPVPGSMLDRHRVELEPLDYAFHPLLGGRPFEGFAEWLRYFINNPADMQARAPGFTAEFLNFLETKRPEYLESLMKHVDQFNKLMEAASVDVMRASVRMPDMRTGAQKVTEEIAEEGFANTIERHAAKVYSGLFDKWAVFARVVREGAERHLHLTGALATKPLPADNPELLWRVLQRSGQQAQAILRYGVPVDMRSTDRAGASLRSTLMDAHVSKNDFSKWNQIIVDDFNVYLYSREVVERWRQFDLGLNDVRPFGHEADEAMQAVTDFELKYPQFRHAADSWMELNRNYLRRLVQARQITEEQYDRIVRENQFYAPSYRERGDLPLSGDQAWDTAAIRKFRGSSRDVLSPIEQFSLMVERFERKIARDEVLRAFERLERSWAPGALGPYFEPVSSTEIQGMMFDLSKALDDKLREAHMPKAQRDILINSLTNFVGEDPMMGTIFKTVQAKLRGEPLVFYKGEDGTEKAARVKTEGEDPRYGMWETLTAMPEYQRHAVLQFMAVTSRVYSGATITDLGYAAMQYVADELAAAGFTKGYIPFISGLRGAKHVFTKDQWFRWYSEMGGVLGHHELVGGEVAARTSVDALAREGYFVEKLSLKGMMELLTTRELFTRTEAFRLHYLEMQKQGVDHWNALAGAAHHATDFFDMGRVGSRMELARAMTPFLSPWMQGIDKARRSLITPVWRRYFGQEVFDTDRAEFHEAGRALFKFGAVGFGLGFGWAAMNWSREVYRDAKPDLKGGYFVMPTGDYGVAVARKPWELSLGFTAGEYAFASLMQKDPRAGEGMIEAAFQVLQPPIPFVSNPVVKNSYELATNKRLFDLRDFVTREPGPIIPKRLEGQRPETQVLPKTSKFAKDVGKLINVSPIKVEYGIGGFFSNFGRNALDVLRSTETDSEGLNLEAWSITKRFSKDPNQVSDAPSRYYEYMSRTTGKFPTAVASFRELQKRGDAGFAAQEFFSRLTQNEKVWVTLQAAGSANFRDEAAFTADDKRSHPFERARLAVGVLNKLRSEIEWNALTRSETNDVMGKFPPDLKKRVNEVLGRMILMEVRNSLTMMKEPGYADRPLFDMNAPFEELKLHAPDLAKELQTRYANASVYRTGRVASVYDALREEVLARGSRANMTLISSRVSSGGYEFGGNRVTVRPRRGVIQGELE